MIFFVGNDPREDPESGRPAPRGPNDAEIPDGVSEGGREEPNDPGRDAIHGRPSGGEIRALRSDDHAVGCDVHHDKEDERAACLLLHAVL